MKTEEKKCKHPYNRIYSWFAYNWKTGKKDLLCAGCCDCGEVLTGVITDKEIELMNEELNKE